MILTMALLSLLMAVGTAEPAEAAAKEGPPFPRIANCYAVGLSPESTPADIAEIARFDLLIGGVMCDWGNPEHRQRLAEKMALVRQRNPHILILDFSSSAPYYFPSDPSFPESGWLLQPNGQRIAGWPGTEMINLTRPEVLNFLAARSVASVKERGFDGTFIDCMASGFDWWACNIESGAPYQVDADRDGKPDDRAWLDHEWARAKAELSRKVRAGIGPAAPFMTNSAGEWGLATTNGILLEDYLDHVLAGNMSWDRVMREYLAWTRVPQKPNVTTIVSSSGIEPPFDAWNTMTEEARNAILERGRNQKERMRFGLATTLMGDGYFAYDLHTRWRGQRWWYPEYDAPLGYAKGPGKRQPDGTWRREFDGGTVVVNPTLLDASVRFRGRHRDASSGKVSTRFVVPAMDGRIFLPTTAPLAPGTLPDPRPVLSLSGPDRVVERADRVLLRLEGAAALFDNEGRLLALTDGRRTLLEQARAFIVKDDRWRDFAYEGCRRQRLPDGRLRFTGRRTQDAVAVSYTLEVRPVKRGLDLAYQWEALSDAHFHMFRQQIDFPLATYGGGSYQAGGARGKLPSERSPEPILRGALRELTARPSAGPTARVSLSGEGTLVDERHYGVEAFRLGTYPTHGNVKAGARWKCTLRIRLAPR
ncbi:MAG: hypothetical protein GX774_09500 [Armatimonadetes bacterium]|nr:hypothetical protein [Armatimonadota bacterium]